jgi:hypothetical protein
VAAPVALALIGMTYQALASRADRRRFPPPGTLLDVGGHRLHSLVTNQAHAAQVAEAIRQLVELTRTRGGGS